MPAGMYLTPRLSPSPLIGAVPLEAAAASSVTKGWNGVLFIHEGIYEGGVFKFRIDFPMSYPLNLPSVKFQANQVFHPFVELESGILDLVPLFMQSDRSHNDQNYVDGLLVRCYEGFATHLLSRIWSIFHDVRSTFKANSWFFTAKIEVANAKAL